MKSNSTAVIFGLSIVLASIFLGNAYVNRNKQNGKIQVTGLGEKDFSSDLIVWEGSFGVENKELKMGYANLEGDKEMIKRYLLSKGVKEENLVFTAVKTRAQSKRNYSVDGKYIGDEFTGYELKTEHIN